MKGLKSFFGLILLSMFSVGTTDAQDWAGLNRYREDNSKLGLPGPGEQRVVFMGNSITDFWIKIRPDFFKGKPYIDRGISGQTSPQMLLRFRADVIALRPAVVLILAGTNDIAGNTGPSTLEMIQDNVVSMVELAKANNIVPVICSVLPAIDFSWKPGQQPAEKIVAFNKMLKKYADQNSLIYLDYHSAMKDSKNGMKAEYSKDGVHPNEAGYKVMEPLAEAAIAKALKK